MTTSNGSATHWRKSPFEKAGIIKPGVPVVTATDEPESLAVIENVARQKNAPVTVMASDENPPPNTIAALGRDAVTLPLPGEHQKQNAALAVATVEVLQKQIPVSKKQIETGLKSVKWPGRLQLIQRPNGQIILLDGAHNVAGAKALRNVLRLEAPVSDPAWRFGFQRRAGPEAGDPITLILGVLQDKDWQHISEILAPLAEKIFTVPVASERTADPNELATACRAANGAAQIFVCASLDEAFAKTAGDKFLLVTGSLYLVGEALEILGLSPAAGSERD